MLPIRINIKIKIHNIINIKGRILYIPLFYTVIIMLDIHSHILPAVDDGAKTTEESLQILTEMYRQGITDVIATPHFYPLEDNLEDYLSITRKAFSLLKEKTENKKVPNIFLGCEILYYSGISKASELKHFTLNGSCFLLLELTPDLINDNLFDELLYLKEERNIVPIIAHIERYKTAKKYRKFIEFVKKNGIPSQVNATSFFRKDYLKTLDKLFSENVVTFIGTDSHSVDRRPPFMDIALEKIAQKYGNETKEKLIENANKLYLDITGKENFNEIK